MERYASWRLRRSVDRWAVVTDCVVRVRVELIIEVGHDVEIPEGNR